MTEEEIEDKLRQICSRHQVVLDYRFLCQSVSALNPPDPICVQASTSLKTVIELLQQHRIGCVLVVDGASKLTGIFSERDLTLKVAGHPYDLENTAVGTLMTRSPVAQPPNITTAYALNLMSHGGFRHLPLIDPQGVPIAILSVKNVIDALVERLTAELLEF